MADRDNNRSLQDFKKLITQNEEEEITLPNLYLYWQKLLISRLMRIFEYDGLPFEQHELEEVVLLNGVGFVFASKADGVLAGRGSLYGQDLYTDRFTHAIWVLTRTDGKSISGEGRIGKDVVVLKNTATMLPMLSFIRRYASLLTHVDLSLKAALVGERYQDVLVAANQSGVDALNDYYHQKYLGNPRAILDKTLLLVDGGGMVNMAKNTTAMSPLDTMQLHNDLMRAFYRDIGIRWVKDKKSQMVADEVNADDNLLLFNVRDMLKQREMFCNEYNRVFAGRAEPISVRLSEDYNYLDETSIEQEREETDDGQSDNQ